MGVQRVGEKRLSYPLFIRADAAKSYASSNISDSGSKQEISVNKSNALGKAEKVQSATEIVVSDSISSENVPLTKSQVKTAVRESRAVAIADVSKQTLFTISTPANAKGTSGDVLVTSISDLSKAGADGVGFSSENFVAHTTANSLSDATSDVSESVDFSLSHASDSDIKSDAPVGVTSYRAKLGGTVRDNSGEPAEGAKVHIIRNNDNKKITSTQTDGDGRWELSLPGKDGDDSDPPVYAVSVYYRDGDKRDPDAKIYNATNRPYIDTADPSSQSPYDKSSQTNN